MSYAKGPSKNRPWNKPGRARVRLGLRSDRVLGPGEVAALEGVSVLGAKCPTQPPPSRPQLYHRRGRAHLLARVISAPAHTPRGLPSCAGPFKASSRPGGGGCWRQVDGKAQLRSQWPGACCRRLAARVCAPALNSTASFFNCLLTDTPCFGRTLC